MELAYFKISGSVCPEAKASPRLVDVFSEAKAV
jgi:hypothetical protein